MSKRTEDLIYWVVVVLAVIGVGAMLWMMLGG
jgi:hypothetical protein